MDDQPRVTGRFHHPALSASPATVPTAEEALDVFALLIAGLSFGVLS